jgi:hypothetical protein
MYLFSFVISAFNEIVNYYLIFRLEHLERALILLS